VNLTSLSTAPEVDLSGRPPFREVLLFAHRNQTGPSSYASRPQQRRKHITCERLTSGTNAGSAAFGNCLPKVGYQGSSDPRTMALLILRACDRPCPPYGWKLRQSLSVVNGGSSRVGEHLRRTTVDEKEGEQQRSLLYHYQLRATGRPSDLPGIPLQHYRPNLRFAFPTQLRSPRSTIQTPSS